MSESIPGKLDSHMYASISVRFCLVTVVRVLYVEIENTNCQPYFLK